MAKGNVVLEIVYDHFPEIAAKLPAVCGRIVQETLFEIETRAKIVCPVDTGNLRASITTAMESETGGVCFTGVEYAAFVEYGTVNMAARPYMTPAGEAARSGFVQKLAALEDSLG